MLKRVFLI